MDSMGSSEWLLRGIANTDMDLQAVSKKMVKQKKKGKITFVSSTLGYMSIVGYASYSPAKHALRGK